MVLIGMRGVNDVQQRRVHYRGYIRIPIAIWGLIFLLAFLIAVTSFDPLLTFACIAVIPMLATLVWREGEPPVAYAAVMAQWLQVSTGPFRATANGLALNDLFGAAGANYATWLSLAGLIVLALAIRVANFNRPLMNTHALHAEIQSYRYSRVLYAYCLAQCANLTFDGMIFNYPGLAQALLSATQLRWVFFFILAVTTLVQKKGYGFLLAAIAFEILLGFTSFFSDFRVVFFVLLVAYLMVRPRISARMIASVAMVSSLLICLAVIWSVVKTDYRNYQNRGTGEQVSMVDTWDKLDKLGELIGRIDFQRFLGGFDTLAKRVEYTEYFGLVTDNVPSFIPYDEGGIWGAAVYHVITPRLFFPEKADLTGDIENTKRYTGLNFTGSYDTEIPLGYMAESYIDFGPIGMFVPIFLLGLLLGYEYRYFASRRYFLVFAYGLTPVVFEVATSYEETAIKSLGGNLTVFIVSYLAWKFAVPVVEPWLRNWGLRSLRFVP
jgi:hypothetical protein